MASGSVQGLTVWVKLRQPQNNDVVYGVVQDLVAGSHLALRDVFFPGSNTRWEHWTVQATAIEDIQVVDTNDPNSLPTPTPPPSHAPTPPTSLPLRATSNGYAPPHAHPPPPSQALPAAVSRVASEHSAVRHASAPIELPTQTPTPQREPASFIDPAILSYEGTASPVHNRTASKPAEMDTPIKSMLAKAAANLPSPGSPFIGDVTKNNVTQKMAVAKQQPPPRAPVFTAPKPAENAVQEDTPDGAQNEAGSKKKVRRGQKTKKQATLSAENADPPPVMNSEVSRNGNDMNGSVKRGKGWRSTPLLQPTPQAATPQDKHGRNKSRRKQKEEIDQMGDTTDIQEMGDFDFEGELKKFDKKQVFDEIRQGDTTADEDRLVSHNKAARPGTYGGKNLHPTEPVLSPKIQPVYNSNELDSSSDADTELNMANGRSSSKHSVSRTVYPKTKPSRQNSSQVDPKPHPLSASISSETKNLNPSTTSLVNRAKAASLAASSPRPDRASSPQSGVSNSRGADHANDTSTILEPHLAIHPLLTPCPTLLPKALESLEAAAVSAFGVSYDAITESAARCIAEAALQLSETHGGARRPSRTNTLRGSMSASMTLNSPSEPATIVVLAGNHETGARALAAARQLLGRGVKIIAAESLYENAETQDPLAKIQSAILRRMNRGGAKIKRGLWRKASSHIKNLSGPPAVIIDALLAGSTYDSLLTSNASHNASVQQETREMIDWANRSRAPVLSVGCPSGVSGVDGSSTIVEAEPLAVRPEKVLSLGAPMQGLLKAMENGEKLDISLADIGINLALKSDEAVAFGGPWVVDLKYVEDGDASTVV
ncbi:hypothetical protein M409DRAFT_59460 [Zasmidium cellare ATCC 36951]|uniref:Enhancer of mRNA-decapping protein 3 n=1 Tax=Zasmidium cellare ATCC 36951 TaxID=1080233 RepID=A0A6A6C4Y7_ZASCE|nr:uncharacterized protein M409DRAFT_59460 [Zasmidium cellare ATCC 36951]KAF2160932.1 hypothetical protein M409DRAFT_59460 [Zasmidium cellare ATCC 36951]